MVWGIWADSVSIPLFILKPYKTPLLHAASESEAGRVWRYQEKHVLGHLEKTTKMINSLGNSPHNERSKRI